MTSPAGRRAMALAAGLGVGGASLGAVAWWRTADRRRARIRWAPPTGVVHHGALAVRTLGRRGPPIVLLHGMAGSNRYWGADFDDLSRHGRLIVPDLLGFGASPRPPAGYGPETHADALAACLAELGVDTPAVVAGHSLGSLVALAFAVHHPTRVASVVAFSPPIYRDPVDARRHVTGFGITGRFFALPGPLAHAACRWMCAHRTAAATVASLSRPGLPAAIARDGVQHSWASYSETMREMILAAAGAGWVVGTAIRVRLIAGARDALVDRALLTELAARHPNVTIERWADGDHDLPLTDPRRCRDAILAAVTAAD